MTQKPRKRDYKAEYRRRQAKAKAETGQSYNVNRRKHVGAGTPTGDTYAGFQLAYDHFNKALFGGELPPCMITLRTFGKARGYFSANRFANLGEMTTAHEIALDPRQFMDRSTVEILSTLVHEMCHLWQQEHGSPSRNGYHNAEWGSKMDDVGLTPSDTAQPGGKRTGQNVSHYIEAGGRFETSAQKLIGTGKFQTTWVDVEGFLLAPPKPGSPAAKLVTPKAKAGKSGKRAKYVCPECGRAAWGKDGLWIACRGSMEDSHYVADMEQ